MSTPLLPVSGWNLATPGGIKYRIESRTGGFSREVGKVTEEWVIEATSLQDFADELLPKFEISGTKLVVKEFKHAELDQLTVSNIDWGEFVPGMPVDPFSVDSVGFLAGSYHPIIKVVIDFTSNTQLEWQISGDASGKFIHAGSAGATTWLTEGQTTNNPGFPGTVKNKDGNLPLTVIAPEEEWTAVWPVMPKKYYEDHFLSKLREQIGRVNGTIIPELYDAPKETILFTGWRYTEFWNWRNEFGSTVTTDKYRLVKVELKFQEKNLKDGDQPAGHNHFWRPNVGWRKLVRAGGQTTYEVDNVHELFEIKA